MYGQINHGPSKFLERLGWTMLYSVYVCMCVYMYVCMVILIMVHPNFSSASGKRCFILYVCMYVCVYVCMYGHINHGPSKFLERLGRLGWAMLYSVCMYVCVYVCMYVCMYVSSS